MSEHCVGATGLGLGERDYADCFLWKIAVRFCARDEGIMPRRCGKPTATIACNNAAGMNRSWSAEPFAKASRLHS